MAYFSSLFPFLKKRVSLKKGTVCKELRDKIKNKFVNKRKLKNEKN